MLEEVSAEYLITLLLWLATLVVLLARAWAGRRPVAGLALAYWVNLAVIHLLGGMILLLPWHHGRERANTLLGFTLTSYAMAGLAMGQFVRWPRLRETRSAPTGGGNAWTAGTVIIFGLVFYFVASALAPFVRSLGAIVSNGLNMSVAGFCLLFWTYYKRGMRKTALLMTGWVLILPAMTLILRGFLGYGVFAMIAVGSFIAVKYSPRITVIVGTLVLLFVGMSLYVTYMRVRDEIRTSVSKEEELSERLQKATLLESNWTWADPGSGKQLEAIDGRLNQNWLVGAARYNIEHGKIVLAEGETIWQAFVALVPRLIWPDKPSYAGSGNLVSRFTGIRFAEGTSVGIGHVMELYVNFGATGVFLGFLIVGLVLSFIDDRAGQHLQAGNVERFLLWFVPGQAFLTVGGTFAETLPAAVGATLLVVFSGKVLFAPPRSATELPVDF